MLNLFQKHRTAPTFFVLGWVADRFPDLVKEIERQGHELATHGYSHRLLTLMQPEEFRADLHRSLEVLSKASSQEVRGFRAPSFSLTRQTLWAVDILRECGIRYDSSVFPSAAYYGAKALVMGAMRVAGRPSGSFLDNPRVLLAPRRPYRPAPSCVSTACR